MNHVTFSEYVPVRMPAVLKAARRWGECHVVQGKADTPQPRILTHPGYWRAKQEEIEANTECWRCKGRGWVRTSKYGDWDTDWAECPVCGGQYEPSAAGDEPF